MRLELIQDYYIIYPNKFQFHKGAIRTESARVEAEKKRDFNSIKVRLEPTWQETARKNALFQFHKGAIRTLRGANANNGGQ